MVFTAHVVSILIASPSDTSSERDAIEQSIHQWNADRAHRGQVILLPLRWEVNAVPVMSDSPQAAINKQLLERADVVIGVFFSRLGQPTERYPSGTVEEILEAHAAGKQVHVYFSTADVPRTLLDVDQVAALDKVREDLRQQALYGEFASAEDLKTQVRSVIEHDLAELDLSDAVPLRGTGRVALQASYAHDREQYTDNRNKIKTKTANPRIVVTNNGQAMARQVRITLTPEDGGGAPARMDGFARPRDIAPHGGSVSYPFFRSMNTATEYTVTLTWSNESGEDESLSHSLSIR